jgi:hypothetical protein
MEKIIPATQTGRIPRCMRIEVKAMQLDIPGWCRGTGIIDDKTDEVDHQKTKGEAEKGFFIFIEQVPCKSQGKGHPAEIKKSCGNVEDCIGMLPPVFVGCKDRSRCTMSAKKAFFQFIDVPDMNGVVSEIGKSLHEVEDDPEYDEDGESEDKSPGRARQVKEDVEKTDEEQLFRFKSYKDSRKDKIKHRKKQGDERITQG